MNHQANHSNDQAGDGLAHKDWMRQALELAQKAADLDETPIGALIVKDGQVIGKGYNLREKEQDVTMHAEIIALRDASRQTGSWRLEGCTLYVTLEPCIMCAGALIQARLDQLVFGAYDPKAGAAGSITDIFSIRQNHQVQVTGGVESALCSQMIRRFFIDLRKKKKAAGSRSVRRQQAIRETEAKQPGEKPIAKGKQPIALPVKCLSSPICRKPACDSQKKGGAGDLQQNSGDKR